MSDLLLNISVLVTEQERKAVMGVIQSARDAVYYQRRVRESYVPPLPSATERVIRASEDQEMSSLDRLREKFVRQADLS